MDVLYTYGQTGPLCEGITQRILEAAPTKIEPSASTISTLRGRLENATDECIKYQTLGARMPCLY
ncbi:hypothetical protein T265_12034 [Opisthorchis viverrini]|uniref:Uncharacterized protein n=1 Tax=Opisthorchis viverrini TaxID=6198 RepID=A0A074Z755_OPIVI|nr:hypothetical protein T265_12034 [Opisthorchis viverrini]KER19050.1 hypothetical protein T265_12034 [Opisthorchis viverrini]